MLSVFCVIGRFQYGVISVFVIFHKVYIYDAVMIAIICLCQHYFYVNPRFIEKVSGRRKWQNLTHKSALITLL